MDKRIIRCAIFGGLIVFVWGMLSWMVLPWHQKSLHQFKDEQKVYEVIAENAPVSGIYILPNTYAHADGMSYLEINKQMVEQKERMTKGPIIFASVYLEGIEAMNIKCLVVSLLIQIIGAGMITWMLLQTKLTTYRKRVVFVTSVGLLVGILGLLPPWNSFGFSTYYTLALMVDLVVGWFLAGLAIGKLSYK